MYNIVDFIHTYIYVLGWVTDGVMLAVYCTGGVCILIDTSLPCEVWRGVRSRVFFGGEEEVGQGEDYFTR